MYSVLRLVKPMNLVRYLRLFVSSNGLLTTCLRPGLAADSQSKLLPEFDREMRRRVWCITQILDWLVSSVEDLTHPPFKDNGSLDNAGKYPPAYLDPR
jgi:hypothetical protein